MTGRLLADSARPPVALAVLVGGVVLAACTSAPAPSALNASAPVLPINVADLRTAPAVTDLAGRFAYGASDGHIWTVDMATGVPTQVTHGRGGADFDPHWSPDGTELVFRTERFRPLDPNRAGYS